MQMILLVGKIANKTNYRSNKRNTVTPVTRKNKAYIYKLNKKSEYEIDFIFFKTSRKKYKK